MITPINSNTKPVTFGNHHVSNKALARLHYIKFLKAEDKFMENTKIYEQQTSDLSLKTILTAAKAFKNFGNMVFEKLVSAHYFYKK